MKTRNAGTKPEVTLGALLRKAERKAIRRNRAYTPKPLTDCEKALLGAIEKLYKINKGEQFSVIEMASCLHTYRNALVKARPDLLKDSYWSNILKNI